MVANLSEKLSVYIELSILLDSSDLSIIIRKMYNNAILLHRCNSLEILKERRLFLFTSLSYLKEHMFLFTSFRI